MNHSWCQHWRCVCMWIILRAQLLHDQALNTCSRCILLIRWRLCSQDENKYAAFKYVKWFHIYSCACLSKRVYIYIHTSNIFQLIRRGVIRLLSIRINTFRQSEPPWFALTSGFAYDMCCHLGEDKYYKRTSSHPGHDNSNTAIKWADPTNHLSRLQCEIKVIRYDLFDSETTADLSRALRPGLRLQSQVYINYNVRPQQQH